MKSFKDLNRQVVQEGRPSQRHPLEGHEYHKKSDEALIHIAKDAHAAAEAMKSHNTTAENKYRDQANDSATVRYFRKKNGMPEWYKKKYGHVKEGVVEEGENNQVKDGDPCWKGYQMVGMKNKGGKKVPNCVPTKEEVEGLNEMDKEQPGYDPRGYEDKPSFTQKERKKADKEWAKIDKKLGIPKRTGVQNKTDMISDLTKHLNYHINKNKKVAKEEVEPIEEAAKGTLHRVRYSHDSSSGNGIASGNLSLHAPDKESASRYAESDLKKRGKKNIKIHAVTPQKSSIKEAKEKTEYDYEGDMARGQLQSIINNAQRVHDMLKDNDNLPEWVQSKITLAEDYISTVANYMMSELDEEVVVEASYKDTRGTLKDRLAGEVLNFHSMHDRIPSTSEFGRSVKSKPKQQAISHAKKLLGVQVKKEEVESIEEADALLARTGMNSAHKFPRAGQTNLKNIPAMNTPGNSKETDDYAEKRRGDRAKQLKPAIKAALGTHGPKGKLPEEVEPIEELSKNTLKSYIPAAARDLSKKGVNAGIDAKSGKPGVTKEYGDHFEKRYKGIIKATRKLAKEGVVNEVMDEPNYSLSIQARQKKADVSKKNDATTSAEIGTPAQLSLKVTPKKLETPVYESRQMQIVREALADAKKKDAAKKKEKKVNPAGDDKFQAEPELTSSITKNT